MSYNIDSVIIPYYIFAVYIMCDEDLIYSNLSQISAHETYTLKGNQTPRSEHELSKVVRAYSRFRSEIVGKKYHIVKP